MKTGFFKLRPHQLFFYLLILFLPTQLGKHFWPDWTMVEGIRIDYLSPTVYLTDILVASILVGWGWEKIVNQKSKIKTTIKNLKISWATLLVSGFLVANVLLAASQPVAFYKFIKILEISLLGLYIAKNHHLLSTIYHPLSVSIIYSSLIAIGQFAKQASLGGLLWWLGERTFNSMTPGIAQASIEGRLILRPYATFPHPNVLGGFLSISLPLLIFLPPKLRPIPFVLGTVALFLSFSQSAWLAFGLQLSFWGAWFVRRVWKKLLNYWPHLLVLLFIASFFSSKTLTLKSFTWVEPESIKQRQDLNLVAMEMIKNSPLLGVGLGNFLIRLPEFYQDKGTVRFLQPAHNLYLLIGAETGLVGLLMFFFLLYFTYKQLIFNCAFSIFNLSLIIALTSILILGLFDHYFYTLQQGQLLAALLLGLSWAKKKGVL